MSRDVGSRSCDTIPRPERPPPSVDRSSTRGLKGVENPKKNMRKVVIRMSLDVVHESIQSTLRHWKRPRSESTSALPESSFR